MVSVLICTFNSARVLPNCLRSVLEQDYASIEVIIVDNASTDGTQELLSQSSGRVPNRIVLNDNNIGFSAAQNQAMHLSRGEWVLTLNPDVSSVTCASPRRRRSRIARRVGSATARKTSEAAAGLGTLKRI